MLGVSSSIISHRTGLLQYVSTVQLEVMVASLLDAFKSVLELTAELCELSRPDSPFVTLGVSNSEVAICFCGEPSYFQYQRDTNRVRLTLEDC